MLASVKSVATRVLAQDSVPGALPGGEAVPEILTPDAPALAGGARVRTVRALGPKKWGVPPACRQGRTQPTGVSGEAGCTRRFTPPQSKYLVVLRRRGRFKGIGSLLLELFGPRLS